MNGNDDDTRPELDSTEVNLETTDTQPEPEGGEQNTDYPNGDETTEEAGNGSSVG